MNKSEMIEAMASELDLSVRTAGGVVETILQSMAEAMAKGDGIELRGFGSFQVKEYKGYTGRNPKSGLQIAVAPKKAPFFKVGKELKMRVDGE